MRLPTRVLLVCLLATTACRGAIVATAELHGAGTVEAHFQSNGSPLVLWADIDGRWKGNSKYARFPAHYEIDVLAGGASLGHLSCDTHHATEAVCRSHTRSGGEESGDCEIKIPSCDMPLVPAGDAVIKVKGEPDPDAIQVSKMSINLRQK
jgi:hypothetical protein